MKETTPAAMPPCFDRWCRRFDDLFNHPAQKKGFRHYLGGLLGESVHKKLISDGSRCSWCDLSQDTSLLDGIGLGRSPAQRAAFGGDG